MVINGICGVLYIGVGVLLGALAATEVTPSWRLFMLAACATNTACGARLLSRAYREAYRADE